MLQSRKRLLWHHWSNLSWSTVRNRLHQWVLLLHKLGASVKKTCIVLFAVTHESHIVLDSVNVCLFIICYTGDSMIKWNNFVVYSAFLKNCDNCLSIKENTSEISQVFRTPSPFESQ